MKKLVIAIFLIMLAVNDSLAETPDSTIWRKMNEREKLILLLGYNRGVSAGCMKIVELGKKNEFDDCQTEFRIDDEPREVVAEIDKIYNDEKNVNLKLAFAVESAKAKLISKRFNIDDIK